MKNMIKNLVRWLGAFSPSCKEATRLQSAALDRPLNPLETFGLRIHLALCKWCRRYGRQINSICSVARQHAHDDPPSRPQGLSSEARERMKQMLQNQKD